MFFLNTLFHLLVHCNLPFSTLVTKVGAHPVSQDEAIDASDIIVIAVPRDFYEDLPVKKLSGKVLVDVSNRNTVARKTALYVKFTQVLLNDYY